VYKNAIFLSILCFLLSPSSGWSHPHVFIDTSVKIVFDEKGLAGARIQWVFDEMFSSMIIMDFDRNKNRRFESDEVAEVKAGAFSNLKEFGYFTHIKIDGKPFKVSFVKDFSAKIDHERMIYTFFVPCHVCATTAFKQVSLSVYDPEFYSDIVLVKDSLLLENRESYEASCRIRKSPDTAYYFGQIVPEEILLRFKRK